MAQSRKLKLQEICVIVNKSLNFSGAQLPFVFPGCLSLICSGKDNQVVHVIIKLSFCHQNPRFTSLSSLTQFLFVFWISIVWHAYLLLFPFSILHSCCLPKNLCSIFLSCFLSTFKYAHTFLILKTIIKLHPENSMLFLLMHFCYFHLKKNQHFLIFFTHHLYFLTFQSLFTSLWSVFCPDYCPLSPY